LSTEGSNEDSNEIPEKYPFVLSSSKHSLHL